MARELDCTKVDAVQFVAWVELYQAVAGALSAAIDSENTHLSRVYRNIGAVLVIRC